MLQPQTSEQPTRERAERSRTQAGKALTMRHLSAAIAVAAAGMLVVSCGGSKQSSPSSSSSSSATTTTTATKPPLAQAALVNLLVTPADIDTALGVTGSKTDKTIDALQPDQISSHVPKSYKFPDECVYATDAALVPVYANSGNTAVYGEHDEAPAPAGANDPQPDADQFVVLFPSADQANAFFTSSSQKWPADGDTPPITWKVGAVSNTNGVLSVTANVTATKDGQTMSQSCQRALTVRNNVVIDTEACNKDIGNAAVTIASQIAGKVDKQ
jgi:PknH-like extracellular domain